MFSAPGVPQNMPECLQREPMSVLQPASMTPEPIKRPWRRKVSGKGSASVGGVGGCAPLSAYGVTADLFAIAEAVPVAHFAVERGQGHGPQPLGPGLVLDPRHALGVQRAPLGFQGQDDLAQVGQLLVQPGIEGKR